MTRRFHASRKLRSAACLTGSIGVALLASACAVQDARAQFSANSFSTTALSSGYFTENLGEGDLDGDGRPDLVLLNEYLDCPLPLAPARSDCRYFATIVLVWGGTPLKVTGIWPQGFPRDVAIGDVDGDGRNDLVLDYDTEIEIRLGLGNREFAPPRRIPGVGGVSVMVIADMDGDGAGEVVIGRRNAMSVALLHGGPQGDFSRIDVPVDQPGDVLIVADFDNDGHFDLLTSPAGASAVSVRLGLGDGTFGSPVNSILKSGRMTAARVDGDDWLDIVYGDGVAFLGNGAGRFARAPTPAPAPTPVPTPDRAPAPTPAPGPWRDDLAHRPVPAWSTVTGPRLPVLTIGQIAAADFDGDGLMDLSAIVQRDTLAVFKGQGNGHFDPPVQYRALGWIARLVARDFTGDGRTDIATLRLWDKGYSSLLTNQQKQTTPVVPASFSVRRMGSWGIVEWRVDQEAVGNSYRLTRDSAGQRVALTPTPLAGQTRYEWIDREVGPGPAEYWIEERTRSGTARMYGPLRLPGLDEGSAGLALAIAQNPLRGSTGITFSLPQQEPVRLELLDCAGRFVARLLDDPMPAGISTIQWDGRGQHGRQLPVGYYFLRLVAGNGVCSAKVLLAR